MCLTCHYPQCQRGCSSVGSTLPTQVRFPGAARAEFVPFTGGNPQWGAADAEIKSPIW